jgi:nucleoside-diphosphate-sugar epimerase
MHVEDCVEALRLVMLDGDLNTVYNIGVQQPIKFWTAIEYAYAQLNSTSEIKFIEQKDFHKKVQAKSFAMNCDKLYALGFYPKYGQHRLIESLLK